MSSNKNQTIVLVFVLLFGFLGVHRFYVGKIGTGMIQLFMFLSGVLMPFALFWVFIDFLVIVSSLFTDGKGLIINSWKI